MDGQAILDAIIEVAKAAAPIIGHGAPEAIVLGEKVLELIDHAADGGLGTTVASSDITRLLEQREEIERRVNAHVDETVSKLRGE